MGLKSKFEIGQTVWFPCKHGRDTIDSGTIRAIWTRGTGDIISFFYDVLYDDGESLYATLEQQREYDLCATEAEAWQKLLSRLRGDLVAAKHNVKLLEQRIEEVQSIIDKRSNYA